MVKQNMKKLNIILSIQHFLHTFKTGLRTVSYSCFYFAYESLVVRTWAGVVNRRALSIQLTPRGLYAFKAKIMSGNKWIAMIKYDESIAIYSCTLEAAVEMYK